jgi:OOP family OmpA-OmpF porin
MRASQLCGVVVGMSLLAGCSTAQQIPVVGGLFGGPAAGGSGATASGATASGATASGSGATATGTATGGTAADRFSRQLAAEYQQLAWFETQQMQDRQDGGIFATKAAGVAGGGAVVPEDPATRDIANAPARTELVTERQRLVRLLSDGRTRAPYEAAVAQARYDCWVEQQEEGWQTNDIRACRAMYKQAAADLERVLATPIQQAAPAPTGQPQYLVFFDFDRAQVTDAARQTLDTVVAELRGGGIGSVNVVGHTDTVGPGAYNDELSRRRAMEVRDALVRAGIDPGRIVTAGAGQEQPLVPTGDEVREASNRRAEIRFR